MQTCFRSFLPVSVPSQQQPVPAMQMEYYESQQNLLNQRNQQSMGLCNTHSFAQPSQTAAVWFPCSTGYVSGASGSVRKPPPNVTVCSTRGSAHIRGPTEIVRHPNSPLQQKMSSKHYVNYNAMWTNSCNNNAVPGFEERSHRYSALPPWHHSAPTIHPTTGLQQQTAQRINVNHVQRNAVGNGTPYCNTSQPLALHRPIRMLPPSKFKTSSSQSQMNCEVNQISSRQPAPSKTFASCRQSYNSSGMTIRMSQPPPPPPPPPYRPPENLVPLKRTLSQGSTSVPQDVTRPQAMLASNQHSRTSPHSIQYMQPQAIHSDNSSFNPTVKDLTSCSTSQVESPANSNVLSAPLLCMLLEMDKKQLQDLTSFDNCRNRKHQLAVQKGGSQKSTQDQTNSQTTTMVDHLFIFHNRTTQNTTEVQRVNEYRAAAKGVGVSRVNVIGPDGPERSNTDRSQPESQFDDHTRPTRCQNSPDCNHPANTPEAATLQRDGQQVYKAVAVVSPISQQVSSQRQVYLLAPSTDESPPLKQGADKTFVKMTDSPNESNTTGALSVLNPSCKTPPSAKASDLECTSQTSTISQSPVCMTDHPPKSPENGDSQVKKFCSNDAKLDLPKVLVRDVTLETLQELTRSLEGTPTDTGKVMNVIKCILDLFWDGKVANMIKVKSTVMYLMKTSSKFHERNSHAVVFQHLDPKHLELLADRYQVLESKVTFSSEEFTSSWLNVDGKPADVDGVLAEPVSDLAWCTNVSLPGSNSTGEVVDSHVAQADSNDTTDLRANALSDVSNSEDIAIPPMPGPLSEEVFKSVAMQSQIKMMSVKNELSNPLLCGNAIQDDVSERQEMAKVTLDSQEQEEVSMFHKDFRNQAVEENEPATSTSCNISFEQVESNDTVDLRANALSDISNSEDIAIPPMPGPLSEEVFISVATQSQIRMMSVKNELSNPLLCGNAIQDDVSERQEMAKVTLDSQEQEEVSMFHKDFRNQAVEENEPATSTSCNISFEQVESNDTVDLRANALSDVSNSEDIAIPPMPGPLSEEVFMSVATQSQIKMMSVKNELSNPLLCGNAIQDDVSERQEMAKVTLDSQEQEVVSMFHKDFRNQAVEENEPAKSTSCNISFDERETKYAGVKGTCQEICPVEENFMEITLLSSEDARKLSKGLAKIHQPIEPPQLRPFFLNSLDPELQNLPSNIKFACPHMTDMVGDSDFFCSSCWNKTPLLVLDLDDPGQCCGSLHGTLLKDANASACLESSSVSRVNTTVDEYVSRENMYGNPRAKELQTSATKTIAEELCSVTSSGRELKMPEVPPPTKNEQNAKPVSPFQTKTLAEMPSTPRLSHCKVHFLKTSGVPTDDILFHDLLKKKSNFHKQPPGDTFGNNSESCRMKRKGNQEDACSPIKITIQLKQHSSPTGQDSYRMRKKPSLKRHHVPNVMGTVHCRNGLPHKPKRPYLKKKKHDSTKAVSQNKGVKKVRFELFGTSRCSSVNRDSERSLSTPVYLSISASQGDANYSDGLSAKQKVYSDWSSKFVHKQKAPPFKLSQKQINTEVKSKIQLLKLTLNDRMTSRDKQSIANQKGKRVAKDPPNAPKPKKLKGATADDV